MDVGYRKPPPLAPLPPFPSLPHTPFPATRDRQKKSNLVDPFAGGNFGILSQCELVSQSVPFLSFVSFSLSLSQSIYTLSAFALVLLSAQICEKGWNSRWASCRGNCLRNFQMGTMGMVISPTVPMVLLRGRQLGRATGLLLPTS